MGIKQNFFLLIISITFYFQAGAQSWEKFDSLVFPLKPSFATKDIANNIYLGFNSGKTEKYDKNLNYLEGYSLPNQSKISFIDPQNNLRLFIFQEDNQSFTILDRFSSVPVTYFIQDLGISYALAACPAPDQNIWIIANNPQILFKIDPLRNLKILESQIVLGDSVSSMRAFQNILIVSSEKGTFVID